MIPKIYKLVLAYTDDPEAPGCSVDTVKITTCDDNEIKRVASAICIALAGDGINPDALLTSGPAIDIGKPMWKFYERAALAAIAAIKR